MRDLLELIHDYQRLEQKLALDVPLSEEEEATLFGLVRLLEGEGVRGDGDRDSRGLRALPRLVYPTAVWFTSTGGFREGRLRNISGGGMALTTAWPLPPGSQALVHVRSRLEGQEYVFPSRVVWSRAAGMGVAFDGMPDRATLAAPDRRRKVRTFTREKGQVVRVDFGRSA